MEIVRKKLLILIIILGHSVIPAQTIVKPKETPPWTIALYQKDVDYGLFACDSKNKSLVDSFFVTRPLRDFLPICHNDCPIVSCTPVMRVPPPISAIKISGTVRVHVLVNEEGNTIYARALNGHALLGSASVKAACRTQFSEYPDHTRQGIMEFTFEDGYPFIIVSMTANRVSN